MTERVPLWRLHGDLLAARLLLALAPSAAARLSAEDHRFLASRHAQLAARWQQVGWVTRAEAHDEKAARHWRAADAEDPPPPPAVAVGLPRSRPYVRVAARGRVLSGRWSGAAVPAPDSPRQPR